jgi:hypothetical protein
VVQAEARGVGKGAERETSSAGWISSKETEMEKVLKINTFQSWCKTK